ncbi:alpha/beta hydrolase [Nocardia sp. NPDC004068]|uniref:alpha/beta hydrolase n=1 Tax=Nocardia sp. NPDC004068 TaxID=3364303 RepID=UPI0036AF157D
MPVRSSPRRQWFRIVSGSLLMVAAVVLGEVAAVAAFFGAALLTATVPILMVTSVVVAFVMCWLAALLVTRLVRLPRPLATIAATVGVLCLVLVATLTVLRPLPGTPSRPRPPEGLAYWALSTGSRLAVLHIPAVGPPRPTPIVVVGGGPGEEDVADPSLVDFFRRFAALGYDVYLYDQIGSGLSERLTRPEEYRVARHVADLEALRERLGTERMILSGASWGGSLVATYMASHPDRVDRAVFTSPAPLDFAEWSDADLTPAARLTPEQRERADALLPGTPRFLLWYFLGRVNPDAAHHLVPDREADAFFDAYFQHLAPGTVCDPARLPHEAVSGFGLYDNVFTVRDAESRPPATRSALTTNTTPALIITGGCNYVPFDITRQYRTTLPNSTLVCLSDAGHVVRLDRPDIYFDAIRAFLLDAPSPIPPWTDSRSC